MLTCFRNLVTSLLFIQNLVVLAVVVTKEDIAKEEWFSCELGGDIIDRSLEYEQWQFLFQALCYQYRCLKEKAIGFSVCVKLGKDGRGSRTEFNYSEAEHKLTITIILEVDEKGETRNVKRPILIKQNGFYRLYQLGVPDFIILAHELLHALNHAELFASGDAELMDLHKRTSARGDDVVHRRNAIQQFLYRKLTSEKSFILDSPYKKFWENTYAGEKPNEDLGDSLDEMTTILCSRHKISSEEEVFIGETLLLREYYRREDLISWSHVNTAEGYVFDQNHFLLKESYVDEVLRTFNLKATSITTAEIKRKIKLVSTFEILDFQRLDKSFIYGLKKGKPDKQEISLLVGGVADSTDGYDWVDENFTLPAETRFAQSVVDLRSDARKVFTFSREEILAEVFRTQELAEKGMSGK